jgi:hypothetical protein
LLRSLQEIQPDFVEETPKLGCGAKERKEGRLIKETIKLKLSLCLTKHHAMKTCWGSGGIVPGILDLGTRWRSVVSFTPRPLYSQEKSPWYPLDRRLGRRAVLDVVVKRKIPSPRRESKLIIPPVAQRYTD